MKPTLKIFSNIETFGKTIAEELVHTINQALKMKDDFSIALAGGKTPRGIYNHCAAPSLRNAHFWQYVHFFWGDERCVPPDHPESNFRMVQEAFLSKIRIPNANIHRIRGEDPPQSEVRRYEKEMKDYLPADKNMALRFDWIFLGVGTDGHTASLFPNSKALHEQRLPCAIAEDPKSGQQRITLTLPVINNSRRITFLVTGKEKATVVHKILSKDPVSLHYPAAKVLPTDGSLEWYLDKAAAHALKMVPEAGIEPAQR